METRKQTKPPDQDIGAGSANTKISLKTNKYISSLNNPLKTHPFQKRRNDVYSLFN